MSFLPADVALLRHKMVMRSITAHEDFNESEKPGHTKKEVEEVIITALPKSKNAVFKGGSEVRYAVTLDNKFKTKQEGTLSYAITDLLNKDITKKSINVSLDRRSSKNIILRIPGQSAGFYKINVMLNLSDYDDTVRRVFGVDPERIKSQTEKPADFDDFWKKTVDELDAVKAEFKVTEVKDAKHKDRRIFGIEMKSWGGVTVRGWMTLPKTTNMRKKFPVFLGLPGYQVGLTPMFGKDEDLAIVVINIRGQGNSRDKIAPAKDTYIYTGLEDKNKYIMRGAIMDCLRMVDFICTREELDHDNIMVSGGSLGGYLAIAAASLDHRIRICSAKNPIMCDIKALEGKVKWPLSDFTRFVHANRNLKMDKIMDNLDYYDGKNFATNVKCPVLVGIGLLDHLAPPDNEYVLYNNLQANKRIMIFKELGHEVGQPYVDYEGRWMHDAFSLY